MWLDGAHLLDMSIAARDAMEFANSLTRDKFEISRLHQYAILKAVEAVAEAASKVSQETKIEHPDIQWSKFSSLCDRLRITTSLTNSTKVHLKILWQTVQNDLPPLIAQLEPLIPPEPE